MNVFRYNIGLLRPDCPKCGGTMQTLVLEDAALVRRYCTDGVCSYDRYLPFGMPIAEELRRRHNNVQHSR